MLWRRYPLRAGDATRLAETLIDCSQNARVGSRWRRFDLTMDDAGIIIKCQCEKDKLSPHQLLETHSGWGHVNISVGFDVEYDILDWMRFGYCFFLKVISRCSLACTFDLYVDNLHTLPCPSNTPSSCIQDTSVKQTTDSSQLLSNTLQAFRRCILGKPRSNNGIKILRSAPRIEPNHVINIRRGQDLDLARNDKRVVENTR